MWANIVRSESENKNYSLSFSHLLNSLFFPLFIKIIYIAWIAKRVIAWTAILRVIHDYICQFDNFMEWLNSAKQDQSLPN